MVTTNSVPSRGALLGTKTPLRWLNQVKVPARAGLISIGATVGTVPTSSFAATALANRNSSVLVGCRNSASVNNSTSLSAARASEMMAHAISVPKNARTFRNIEGISSGPLMLSGGVWENEKNRAFDPEWNRTHHAFAKQ